MLTHTAANYWTTVGLLMDMAGATLLTIGLFVTKETAVELSMARFASKEFAEKLKHPQVQDRLRVSLYAIWGLPILIGGFMCQLIGTWL
jgi:hypothetical protein